MWITVDINLSPPGTDMKCLFPEEAACTAPAVPVTFRYGRAVVQVTVPAGGFLILSN